MSPPASGLLQCQQRVAKAYSVASPAARSKAEVNLEDAGLESKPAEEVNLTARVLYPKTGGGAATLG